MTLDRPRPEADRIAAREHFDPDRVAGVSRRNLTALAFSRSGRPGAKRFRIARQARPIVFSPCEIGLSNPASRAITGSAWIGM